MKIVKKYTILIVSLVMVSLASAAYGNSYINSGGDTSSNAGVGLTTNTNADTNYTTSDSTEEDVDLNIGADVKVDSIITVKTSEGITKVILSDGGETTITISSTEAKKKAESSLEVENCSNCEVELTEESVNGKQRAVYEVKAKKESKVFGLFKNHMDVEADIDAETGEVVKIEKPWWSFLATESKTSINTNTNSEASMSAGASGSGGASSGSPRY